MTSLGNIIVFSFIATVILFSSGISLLNANHLRFIKRVGTRNKYFRWVSQTLLSIIIVTSRVRRAWIRMITPGGGPTR